MGASRRKAKVERMNYGLVVLDTSNVSIPNPKQLQSYRVPIFTLQRKYFIILI